MEKELLKLAISGDQEGVNKLLTNVNLKKVLRLVHSEAVQGSSNFLPAFRALLQGYQEPSEDSYACRYTTYQFGLNLLRQVELSLDKSSQVVGLLLIETDSFDSSRLAEVATVFLDAIQDGEHVHSKWLEVFPKVLMTVSSRPQVSYGGETWSGVEFKSHMVQKLLSSSWMPSVVISLATILREVPLKLDELSQSFTKLLAAMNQMEITETPSLVYEMLLLASKGHRAQVLEGILAFYTRKDQSFKGDQGNVEVVSTSETMETLLQVEGTVILHLSFAVKQDQELGREFLKLLKAYKCNPQHMLSPFCLSLALALAKIQRFQQQILEMLKSCILNCFREEEKKRSSAWMREVDPNSKGHSPNTLLTVARNSKHGWDHVTQGLLQLALDLLDSKDAMPTLSHSAATLASDVLRDLFKAHSFVRGEILEQLLNRRIMQSGSISKRYIDALGAVVGNSPNPSSFSNVRQALESLPFLHDVSARPLLLVLMPLLRISPTLRDTLILVVRKSLFRRDVEARKVAVSSLLAIVTTHRFLGGIPLSQGSSSSQVTVESSGNNSASNEALCLELLGILRRALTQQAEVRTTLYQGLPEVLEKNSQLSEPVLDLLTEQLQKYIGSDDVGPPLKLEACIRVDMDVPQLLEPLAELLRASRHCMAKREVEGQKLRLQLKNLVKAICQANLEDFELDKSSDYGTGSVGLSNRMRAEILSRVYESLMEFCLLCPHLSVAICEDVLSLLSGRQKILEVLKENQKKDDKKAVSRQNSTTSILSPATLAFILGLLFCEVDRPEGVELLKESPEFLHHLVCAVGDQVHCHRDNGNNCSRACNHFATIARALLKRYVDGQVEVERQQTADALAEVVSLYKNQPTPVVIKFFTSVSGGQGEDETGDGTSLLLKDFLHKILILLGDGVITKPKEAIPLVTVAQAIAEKLPHQHAKESYDSLRMRCFRHFLGDAQVARSLLVLALTLGRQDKMWPKLLREVSSSVHQTLGDIGGEDSKVEAEQDDQLTVSPKTAAAIIAPILQHVDLGLEEISWAMGLPSQDTNKERAICSRLGRLGTVLKELVRSAIVLPTTLDSVLKTLTRFYNVSSAMSKHYLAMYASKTGHLNGNFEKLVKFLGTEMTPNVYNFLSFIQDIHKDAVPPNKALDCFAEKAKVLRESRAIPPLIFAIEQYEQCLIKLSKKSKVNLMAHIKHSTARDFRIRVDMVQQEDPESNDSQELATGDQNNDASSLAEERPPPKKRTRK